MKACVKNVEALCKGVGQIQGLCTKPTAGLIYVGPARFLATAFTTAFAQAFLAKFNLLAVNLYPLSTSPMITTNLINKEK